MYYYILGIVITIVILYFFKHHQKKEKVVIDNNINEWSFQRYAKFYGNMVLKDNLFQQKMETICNLVLNQNVDDIKFIAQEANCSYEECILKIKYLKNKRKIGDLYIDHMNGLLKKCSIKDQKLLNKYSVFLYKHHLQIDEIALKMPNASSLNLEQIEKEVFDDLVYLNDKGLINGIILNKVDRMIVYYTVEKNKKENDFITINCPNCGAINDVNRGSKVRCEYCESIISGMNEELK